MLILPLTIVVAFHAFAQSPLAAAPEASVWKMQQTRGCTGISLDVEGREAVSGPYEDQVTAALEQLTPSGGPGFLILTNRDGDYAQVAGGKGAFTAEWREYADNTFRHWVAGRAIDKPGGQVAIATNGFQITVNSNEKLISAEAKSILLAFCRAQERPPQFSWRDVTTRFQ
jgi:hypothetical protein